MATLPTFTDLQRDEVHALLALTVAEMMGRKLEEADWSKIYCTVKGIPERGWSNLNIDVMHENLGVEHKMLCYRSRPSIEEACGTTLMHPSATRSIRIESTNANPNEVMTDVLNQYSALIGLRRRKVEQDSGSKESADMRTGWLLWQETLRQFLYFEEPMVPPNASDFYAEWHESTGVARKPSKNLWIYEKSTGRKRYSVTTAAGIKIQPYFDVPPPSDPNLYIWTVIGEHIDGMVRVWLTRRTSEALQSHLGGLDPETLNRAIAAAVLVKDSGVTDINSDRTKEIVPLLIPESAYLTLLATFEGVNDEHLFQMLVDQLSR